MAESDYYCECGEHYVHKFESREDCRKSDAEFNRVSRDVSRTVFKLCSHDHTRFFQSYVVVNEGEFWQGCIEIPRNFAGII